MAADRPAAPVSSRPMLLGLRGRYTLYGAALTSAVVVIMTTLSYFNARTFVHGIAESRLTQMANSVKEPIERALDVAYREVIALSEQPLLVNALMDSQGREAYLRPFLVRHVLPVEIDYNLILTDYRGEPIAARKAPRSFRGERWIEDALLSGRPQIELGRQGADNLLRIVVPILFGPTGTYEGTLVFEANLTQWLHGRGAPFDLDDTGVSSAELILGDRLLVRKAFHADSSRFVTSTRPVRLAAPMPRALQVRVSMEADVFEEPIRDLLVQHVAWGVLAVLLVGAANSWLARAQTRRIEDLAGEARELARTGRLRQGLRPDRFGRDEVGDLAASLVRLFEDLKAHESELERLVAQRTADLNRAQAISHVGSWVHLPCTRRVELSAEARHILGVEGDGAPSWRSLLRRVHPDDRRRVRAAWKSAVGGEAFDIEHRVVVRGETRWVREIAERGEAAGRDQRRVGTLADVTERRLAEDRMREALVVFGASSQGIMTTDANGIISSVNPAFCRITGFPPDEVVGRKSSIFRSGRHDGVFYEAMWAALKARGEWEGEIWNRRRNGEIYPQWLTISAVRGEQGDVVEFVALFSDITERKRHEEEIWRQANFDSLTGLANRSLLYDRLGRALVQARRNGGKVGLLFLDLDGFKWVNDTLGHDVGDELLVEVARRLSGCVREQDTVARLGGDEFTVVVSDVREAEDLHVVGEKVLSVLGEPFALADTRHHMSASVGITLFPDDGEDVHTLLRNADIAMYKSKQNGKNRFHFYAKEMQTDALERMRLEAELREALARGEFALEFQPIVEAHSGVLMGAEALLRWPHAERGMIPPADFIPVAEDCGLIVPIGSWVMREAARQQQLWRARGHALEHLAVNVSGVQFRDPALRDVVARVLQEFRVEPGVLTLEICESVMVDANRATEQRMRELKELGIGYSLDDFGTGFSSLSYLKRFPVDIVKIDRSFVRDCPDDRSDAHLVEAIIHMAHSLGLKVVAEGVETAAQVRFLRELGCDYLQGYLIGRPQSAQAFEALLQRRVLIAPLGARAAEAVAGG